jgi:glycosyltransferase involved in cell wall biosynthesis
LLLQYPDLRYTIIICGRNLPEGYKNQIEKESKNIIYTGFVDDIVPYFLAADIFINPVIYGGGIKTKLVEALSYNCNVVSTVSGATGIPTDIAQNKMQIVNDNDWEAFANAVIKSDLTAQISPGFYEHFYWGNIARQAVKTLQEI